MPPQSGFFFGSTDVDEWYWRDLELTIKQLNRVLSAASDLPYVDFTYRASW